MVLLVEQVLLPVLGSVGRLIVMIQLLYHVFRTWWIVWSMIWMLG